jgi:proteic killer suppression protein
MIRNIAGKATQDVYDGVTSRHARSIPRELHGKAIRLLDQINAAPTLEFLRTPPSNRLEKLRGGWAGYWSLRINDQWRVVFRWEGNDAVDVEIVDYHR